MQKFLLAATLVIGGALLAGDLEAHGGTYRGPGDTVPPGAGGDTPPSGAIPGSGTAPSPTSGNYTGPIHVVA